MPRNIGGEELGQAGVAPTHLIGGMPQTLRRIASKKARNTGSIPIPMLASVLACYYSRGPEAALLDRFKLLLEAGCLHIRLLNNLR